MTDLIKVNDFAFAYEKNNLLFQHLNFALQAGEILAILGQNGCGKSTLLDLLLGIHRPLQAEQDFASLSGGQRQLILIARAIASECRLMLLDEPTSALDLANQDAVLSLLRQLAKKHGLGIIFTTHQPNHAQAIADKTLLINRNFIRFGQTDEILTSENLTALFHLPMIVEQSQYQQQPFSHFVPVYEVLLEGKRDE